MASIIVINRGSGETSLTKFLEVFPATTHSTLLVDVNETLDKHQILSFADDTVYILDEAILANLNESALSELVGSDSGFCYLSVEKRGEIADLTSIGVEGLVSMISSLREWPLLAVRIPSDIIEASLHEERFTAQGLIASALVIAVSHGEQIRRTQAVLENVYSVSIARGCLAQALRGTLAQCNIEDIFPQHAWETHEEESAAASYHSLAALFLRFGDTESALECLGYSDQLEDSPRSLALKGLIALQKGETLGAVANMVSSLQQYELRKRNNRAHYISFNPSNFDVINVKLSAGLEALNKRDNAKALSHFAEAVFQFDPFYSECGLDKLEENAH